MSNAPYLAFLRCIEEDMNNYEAVFRDDPEVLNAIAVIRRMNRASMEQIENPKPEPTWWQKLFG